MASAVVNNVAISPEGFLPSYGWLSPRVSFSRELSSSSAADDAAAPSPETPDLDASSAAAAAAAAAAAEMEFIDFEFRLEDPVAMLPADELFADGKLVPLKLTAAPTPPAAAEQARNAAAAAAEVGAGVELRRMAELAVPDPYVFSPKAPSCSSRWRELLRLRRSRTSTKPDLDKPSSSPSAATRSPNPNPNPSVSRSLKHLLHRGAAARSGGAIEPSLSLPLLRDSDSESLSISSRLSLSSSSSSGGPDHDDLPRLSLDSDKPPRVRLIRPCHDPAPSPAPTPTPSRIGRRAEASSSSSSAAAPPPPPPPPPPTTTRGASVDSPRMNPSGKVVFQGLERSSSSPGSFPGGLPKTRLRGMERSYSANVRVTPVLNVPVCSLRGSTKSVSVFGFGPLFSPQKNHRDPPGPAPRPRKTPTPTGPRE